LNILFLENSFPTYVFLQCDPFFPSFIHFRWTIHGFSRVCLHGCSNRPHCRKMVCEYVLFQTQNLISSCLREILQLLSCPLFSFQLLFPTRLHTFRSSFPAKAPDGPFGPTGDVAVGGPSAPPPVPMPPPPPSGPAVAARALPNPHLQTETGGGGHRHGGMQVGRVGVMVLGSQPKP